MAPKAPKATKPEKEGKAEQQDHAHATVLGALDAPHEAECDRKEEQEGHQRAAGQEGKLHLYTDKCAKHGWQHGQGKQHEGVAQDLVLLQCQLAAGLARHLKLGLHTVLLYVKLRLRR